MAHPVIMPQMGESIAEGTVTQWLKKVGDFVERDEPLFEISTDKVDAEIPSPATGVLREIKVHPGETVAINTVVAILDDESELSIEDASVEKTSNVSNTKAKNTNASDNIQAANNDTTEQTRRRNLSSPLVRKIATKHKIDISNIAGSGVGGRVTKDDILRYIEASQSPAMPNASSLKSSADIDNNFSSINIELHRNIPEAFRPRVFSGDRIETMSTMRAKIAEHMQLSRRISAHVQTVWEVDVTKIINMRQKYKQKWQEQHGVSLTYTSFLMKVTIDAIKTYPVLNASLDENKIIYHQKVNLGFAVALDWGLIVPVIHHADELNLLGLQRRVNDLAARARNKKLSPDEVQNGTFTITNPGVFGCQFGLPIIAQPQVAIMGIGAIEKRPVVIDDMIAIRSRMYFSLSFDHRVIDGAVADQFMSQVKANIEGFKESNM
ncbi:MAG: 2-oxo acid dehydrogenase subunit E2 [Deltaproteobacteria bacterium]|nr:2-oxo acid dehydrogenase subunit E2 [Deltaproteobacteria bacterium]